MPGDSVEGLGDINSGYKGSKGGFAMILAFENGLRERGEQSGGRVEGSEPMLGVTKGNRVGDPVEN
jgi:hypothetical protein